MMQSKLLLIILLSVQLIFTKTVFTQVKKSSFSDIKNRVTPFFLGQSVNDFSMIDSLISQKSIIILSEDTHQDGSTEDLRTEIIKYLIVKKGFKVLLTESSLHETYFINSCISESGQTESCIDRVHNGYFTRKAVVNFLRFIKSSLPTNSVFIGGFDIEMQGRYSWVKLIDEAEAYPEVKNFIFKNKGEWNEFKLLVIESFGVGVNNNIDDKWYQNIAECVSKIRLGLKESDTQDKLVKDKIWENLLDYSRWTLVRPYVKSKKSGYDEVELSLFYSLRDSLMFENFKWFKKAICDSCKVIVVVSAYHSQKNYNDGSFKKYMAPTAMTFGEYLNRSEFKDQIATFAFVSSIGQRGAEYTPIVNLPKMNFKSLEQYLFNRNVNHAFINLKSFDFPFYMAPLHYSSYIKTNWSKVFDGVFYSRIMYPNYRYD